MRTIPTALTTLTESPETAAVTYFRLEVDRGGGDWVDLVDYLDRDWVESVSVVRSIETSAAVLSVKLYGVVHGVYSSPFLASSVFNASGTILTPPNPIRMYVATVPQGTPRRTIGSSEWVLFFQGKIDSVANNGTSLTCRDRAAYLLDTWIEYTDEYGANDGSKLIEEVIQDLLTDHSKGPLAPVTLYGPNGTSGDPYPAGDATAFAIIEYEQQRQSLFDAVKVLADQIGYDIRYRYHEGSGINDFVLVLEEPDRTPVSTALTVTKSMMLKSPLISFNDAYIRNYIVVVYNGQDGKRENVFEKDDTSINAYGRRWMEISEESSSQIDTEAEATALAAAALADLKDPIAQFNLQIPFFYPLQLKDYITIEADDVYFDSNKDLAVVSIEDTFMGGQAITTIRAEGTPATRKSTWTNKAASHPTKQTSVRNVSTSLVQTENNVVANNNFQDYTRS